MKSLSLDHAWTICTAAIVPFRSVPIVHTHVFCVVSRMDYLSEARCNLCDSEARAADTWSIPVTLPAHVAWRWEGRDWWRYGERIFVSSITAFFINIPGWCLPGVYRKFSCIQIPFNYFWAFIKESCLNIAHCPCALPFKIVIVYSFFFCVCVCLKF